MSRHRISRRGAVSALLLALAVPASAHRAPKPWQALITSDDRYRLRFWRDAFVQGVTQARDGGFAAAVAAEGALLEPDAETEGPTPPDGDYRCRTIKLGVRRALPPLPGGQVLMHQDRADAQQQAATPPPGGHPFVRYPAVPCRIAASHLVTLEGPQRPAGRLYPFEGTRLLFLGAVALADDRQALEYGRDYDRDMVGLVQHVGEARWRLVLPRPNWQSLTDVVEIVPAPTG